MTQVTKNIESSLSGNNFGGVFSFGLGMMMIALVLALAVATQSLELKIKTEYANEHSRRLLANSWPDSLSVQTPDRKAVLSNSDLVSWKTSAPLTQTAKPELTLTQYFFAQSGTSHPWASYESNAQIKGLAVNETALGTWVLKTVAGINREPQDAVLAVENNRAVKFTPHQDGYLASAQTARHALKIAILDGAEKINLPLETKSPHTRLGNLNNLGIEERIAVGQSDFTGSSAARINNIRVGAERYNGVILAPGEEFSFNKYLGPVDAEHGFKPELVIKPEGATPEFGGGLCQVSTTAFRAAFFGGLPITQRRNHSYAVRYYEWIADDKPRAVGLDATIYAPYQDMKFANDTSGSLLIWTRIEGKRLYFDFYGTPDDREVAVDGPHPFDKKPSGAVKSTVSRKVTKNGSTVEVTFNSAYIPAKVAEQSFQPAPAPAPPPPPTEPPTTPAPTN